VKHRRAALIALRVGRSKTTAWQAKSMECFFYVYVLVSEVVPQSIIQASREICPDDCKSTTGAVVHIPQNTNLGKLKRPSHSHLKRKPAHSRNI